MLARSRDYLIWGLSDTKYTDKIFKIQKNAVRVMTKAGFIAHISAIFKSLEIRKVKDQITLLNCLFVHDSLNGKLPKSFINTFIKLNVRSNSNTVSTINSKKECLFLPNVNTSAHGLNSLLRNSIISWNSYIKLFKNDDVAEMSKNELKTRLKNICYLPTK